MDHFSENKTKQTAAVEESLPIVNPRELGMWLKGVKEEWPLQRLVTTLADTRKREKELWKLASLSPHATMKDIGPDDRDDVVAWFAQLTILFHFNPETFFLATSILDRFITSVKAQPKYLKCIAISSFYLASKIAEEEDIVPCTGELVKDSECGCCVKDVLRMERIILEKLSWDINSSTALDYLNIFQVLSFAHFTDLSSSLSLPHHMGMLTNKLIRVMSCYELARFPSAALSLALVSFELESITKDPVKWTNVTGQLQSLAKVTTDDLMSCRQALSAHLPTPIVGRVFRKTVCLKNALVSAHRPKDPSAKVVTPHAGGGAMKRKAVAVSPAKLDAWSKKPHPDLSAGADMMEVEEEYDSDKTLTASEGEEDEREIPTSPTRPPTYAEIVKCGLNVRCEVIGHQNRELPPPAQPSGAISTVSRRCSVQASCGFMSPALSSNHGSQRGIRT